MESACPIQGCSLLSDFVSEKVPCSRLEEASSVFKEAGSTRHNVLSLFETAQFFDNAEVRKAETQRT